MALWGVYDAKPMTNTATATVVVTAANSTVKGVNTKFATDVAVGDMLNVGQNDYAVTVVSNNNTLTVTSGINGGTLVGASSNAQFTFSQKPKYIKFAHVDGDEGTIYGVSASEKAFANTTEAGAVTHTGWNKRTVGSGGRTGRVFYECLVAGGISGDARDDAKLPE